MQETWTMSTTKCEPGMVVSSDIVNEYGAVILYRDSVLDEHAIAKLSKLGIEYVQIYREYELKEKKQAVIEAQYNNCVQDFKQVVWDISCGRSVDMQLVQDISRGLTNQFDSINDVVSCLNKVRAVDEYTYTHSMNVSLLCSLLGSWLNLDTLKVKQLTYCGLMHDIGKSKIPHEILNKPDALTPKEFEEIKKHPVTGYKLLDKNIAVSKDIAAGVLMHHEREDGSGYPLALKSGQIHFFAKVVAVADVYDAMTSNRIYKRRLPPFDVLEMFESEYLTKCDASIMLTFLRRISSYYIGTQVKLNNGKKGEIIYINPNRISRPLVKVGDQILDLSYNMELRITEMV